MRNIRACRVVAIRTWNKSARLSLCANEHYVTRIYPYINIYTHIQMCAKGHSKNIYIYIHTRVRARVQKSSLWNPCRCGCQARARGKSLHPRSGQDYSPIYTAHSYFTPPPPPPASISQQSVSLYIRERFSNIYMRPTRPPARVCVCLKSCDTECGAPTRARAFPGK